MVKVITYGTYDMLHRGHIRLLERAKALGDYLIVGVTADDFDKTRGKINVQQSLMERIDGVKSTGLADEIIVEEYEGQKIDDIKKYDVDIFTVGSDWKGKFDYLNEYCKVVYLERTQGVSSTEIREGCILMEAIKTAYNTAFSRLVLLAKEYLDEHYTERITLDDLAERFFINKFYLSKIFKETYGTTVNNYLISKRITRAKQLLRFTDMTVDEVGAAVGMGDANYFSRMFRKVEGISPREYRKQW